MKNNKVKPWHLITFMVIVACVTFMIYDKPAIIDDGLKTNCKDDSLQTVINELEMRLKAEQKEKDQAELKYKQVVFEYEYGLEHLKNYEPHAYKEFHRIIGFVDHYDTETEIDNKKRLTINKF